MTTISYCAYSPNKQPLTPLDHDKIGLLKKGARHDITSRVKDVVQRHLDYKGTEKFRVEFTRQQIIFSLKSGSDVQNRTLKNVSGKWMLSKNSAPATALAPELQTEVDRIIEDVLYRIRNSHDSGAPVSHAPSFTHSSSSFDTYGPRYESAPRVPLETRRWGPRTPSFESHSSSSSFDSREREALERRVSELQRQLEQTDKKNKDKFEKLHKGYEEAQKLGLTRYDELRGKFEEAERANADKAKAALELQEQVAKLEASLKEKEKECEDLKSRTAAEIAAAHGKLPETQSSLAKLQETAQKEKTELQRQLLEARKANVANDETSRAAKDKIAELEASVAEKEAQLRESQGTLELLRTQATEAQTAIKSQLATVTASLEKLQGIAQNQIAQLEEQLSGVQAELSRAKESNAEVLAKAALEIAALKTQLAAASSKAETKFADDIAGLRKLIEEKTTQLEEAARIAEVNKKQIEELQNDLKSAIAQAEEMKKAQAAIQEQLAAEQAKAQKMEASFKKQLAFKQEGIEKLGTISRQFQAKVSSKTEENVSLKVEAEAQLEEISRLNRLLHQMTEELKRQAAKIERIKRNYHSITKAFPSLAVEYGAFLNFDNGDEDGFETLDKSIKSKPTTLDQKTIED